MNDQSGENFFDKSRDIQAALDESSIISVTDSKGIITYVNDKFCEISKYTRDELIGQDHRLINSGYHSKVFIRHLWKTIEDGQIWHDVFCNRAQDGTFFWVDTTIVPFSDANGKPFQYVAIHHEITKQKLAEQKLIEQIEKLQKVNKLRRTQNKNLRLSPGILLKIFGNSSRRFIISDLKTGKILEINRSGARLFGYRRSEMLNRTLTSLGSYADPADHERALEILRKENRSRDFEISIRTSGGETRDVIFSSEKIKVDGHERILTVIKDITARNNAERRLRESEMRMRLVLQASQIGIWIHDVKTDQTYWSAENCRIFGLKEFDGADETFWKMVDERDRERISAEYQKAIKTGDFYDCEFRIRSADGKLKWVYALGQCEYGEDGTPARFFGTNLDVTNRKEVDEKLRASEERLKIAVEVADFAICEIDYTNSATHLTKEAAAIFDFGDQAVTIARDALHKTFHPEDASRVFELIRQALDPYGDGWFDCEHRILRKNGETRWVSMRKKVFFDHSVSPPQPERAILVAQDITERKAAEEKLAAGEILLLGILDSISAHVAVIDRDAKIIAVNKSWTDFTLKNGGADHLAQTGIGANYLEACEKASTVSEASEVAEAIKELLAGRISKYTVEYACHSDSEKRWFCLSAMPLLYDHGGAVITHTDITASKIVEQALRESEGTYRSLFESMQEGYMIAEAIRDHSGRMIDYRFRQVNPAFEKLTGLDRIQSLGKTAREILPGLEEKWFEIFQNVIDNRETLKTEDYIPPLNEWYSITAFYYGEEQFAVLFDKITERKRREANLQFLAEISKDFANLTNIDETIEQVCEKIGRFFGVKQCMFAEHTDKFETSIVTYGWTAGDTPDLKGAYRLRDFLLDEMMAALMSGEPLVVGETQRDSRVNVQSYDALGIHSFIIVPLISGKDWRFQLSIIDDKPRDWTEEEVGLARELTTRIWTRLERARSEEALRESEEKLRLLVEHAPASVAMFDRGMRYLAVSRRWMRDYNLKGEIIGRKHYEVFPRVPESWKEIYRKCLTGAIEKSEEDRFERIDGSLIWIKWEAHPWFESEGEIGGIVIFTEDITERKIAQQAVEEQNKLIEQSYDAIFIWNIVDGITYWNQNAERLYGYTIEEAIGTEAHKLLNTVFPKPFEDFIGELIQNGFWEGELIQTTKTGKRVVVESRLHTIEKDRNHLVVLETTRDVTERRRLEEKLARAAQLSMIGEFAAGLAHEIKNPLAGIKGVIDILIQRRKNITDMDEESEILESVRHEIERIDQTVRALLQHSRPKPLELRLAPLDETVRRAAQLASHRKSINNSPVEKIPIVLDLPPTPLVISHDPAAVEDCVLNLILNAGDAIAENEDGKIIARLSETKTEMGEAEAIIEISDNGDGIAPEKLPKIFTPFQTTKGDGTGLGLSSVKRIARAHGGDCEVASIPGEGSIFTIRLPFNIADKHSFTSFENE